MKLYLSIAFVLCFLTGYSQNKLPSIQYTISIDTNNLQTIDVKMQVKNNASNFTIAMFAHPEYDDKYWRYVKDITVNDGTIKRKDSAVWNIVTARKNVSIHYKISLPPSEEYRGSWKPFLSSTGGLIDGTHLLFYIEGRTKEPSLVTLRLPKDWKAATALSNTEKALQFYATDAFTLMDAPILIGRFKKWSFKADNKQHDVAYWYSTNATSFDENKLISSIQKITEGAKTLFGTLPYQRFVFLLQDNAWGALEHKNSVTVGAASKRLAEGFTETLNELAHEYFHAWNLMRIRPVEYGDVSYKYPPYSPSLWFSEGATMFYADLLLRRTKLPVYEATRIDHLKELLNQYYNSPGYRKLSAELISKATNGPQSLIGDYTGSTHLQGELITVLLDLMIRNATNGKASMDNVMRKMMQQYATKGFTGKDVFTIVNDLCHCNAMSFYEQYITQASTLPFNDYLKTIGYEMNVQWQDAKDDKGDLQADKRVYAWQDPTSKKVRIGLIDPESTWGKAGLHTGDTLISINNTPLPNARLFFDEVGKAKLNDTIQLVVRTKEGDKNVPIVLTTYKQAIIELKPLNNLSEKQKRLQAQWLAGN